MPYFDQPSPTREYRSLYQGAQLEKWSIRAGFILWLRPIEDQNDARLYDVAGLGQKASKHPVVVVNALEGESAKVQICTITSCGSKNITESRIDPSKWKFLLPISPNRSHPQIDAVVLHLKSGAMRKPSYVDTRRKYIVPLRLLTKFDEELDVSSHCLRHESLEALKASCRLVAPAQPATTLDPPPCSSPVVSQPLLLLQPIAQPPVNHLGQDPVVQVRWPPMPGSYMTGHQRPPLLPPPSTSRSYYASYGTTDPIARRPQGPDRQEPRSPIWRAVGCIALCCLAIIVVAGLVYMALLGFALLMRTIMTFLAAAKADILAGGRYTASVAAKVAKLIAAPLGAIGKGFTAAGRGLAHVAQAIAVALQRLKGRF